MTKQDQAGCVTTERGTLMQVGEGRVFYPLDPRASEVDVKDIAKSLSRIFRFNGHSDEPISVAQHSVQCMQLASQGGEQLSMLRYMLMHDAAEAYIGDMIRPLKIDMPQFQRTEKKIWLEIVKHFSLVPVDQKQVKYYDNVACMWEKRDMFKSAMPWPGMPDINHLSLPNMKPWSSEYARARFLYEYYFLWSAQL